MSKSSHIHFLTHFSIAFSVITAIAAVMTFTPHSMWQSALIIIFMVVSEGMFLLNVGVNRRFSGYGVAHKVNAIAKSAVVPSYMPAWKNFALLPLARSWQLTFLTQTAMVAISTYFITHPEEGAVASLVAEVFLTYATARILALVAEIYVWLMADRHRHWYVTEGRLRSLLAAEKRRPSAVEAVVAHAREQGLLLKPF